MLSLKRGNLSSFRTKQALQLAAPAKLISEQENEFYAFKPTKIGFYERIEQILQVIDTVSMPLRNTSLSLWNPRMYAAWDSIQMYSAMGSSLFHCIYQGTAIQQLCQKEQIVAESYRVSIFLHVLEDLQTIT